jgi:benzoate membrane transport protein
VSPRPARRGWPSPPRILRDLGADNLVNAFVGFLFASTGPVAIILKVGIEGGLSEAEIASWMFGSFFLNGLISIAFCLHYRQPLVFFWSIPGAVLVGPALDHMSFAAVLGAYHATGVLMLLLGVSGLVRRAMALIPMPIVMGMVAGVFLRFGLGLVHAVESSVWLALPMVATFLGLSAWPRLARWLPPMLATLAVGAVLAVTMGEFGAVTDRPLSPIVRPLLLVPEFTWPAMVELVVPLAITVLVVQNGQGSAVLQAAGHPPPVSAAAAACGIGSIASAVVGGVSTCLTGPVNAILTQGRDRHTQYAGGIVVALLGMAFGALAPVFTRLLLAAPGAFIATIAGLAMLRPLQVAFQTAFRDRCTMGALVTFLVTVSDIAIANIGAAFWGLLAGLAVSWALERGDMRS